MADPVKTPVAPSMISRAIGATVDALKAWFGPGEPLPAVAPPEQKGRTWDYPFSWNIPYTPRGETGGTAMVSFALLRMLADPASGGLDLLRLAIETRKDQMEGQKWTIRPKLKKGERSTPAQDKRAEELKKSLEKPDGVHTFSVWQRMLIEDMLVIDATSIYLEPKLGGGFVPQVMDGALLKILITEDGRTPQPPDPAFTQVVKGVPAWWFAADEIVYAPRNLRSNKVYGMSPVEQVLLTVNVALRRELSRMEFYTVGSVPDVIFGTPATWNADQVKYFQDLWDSLLAGDTAARRRARFVPGDVKPYPLKPDAGLKDVFDEWLARVICWAFSLSPQALVAQMNRATAETAKEAAQEEGLEPVKQWWKGVMDEVIVRALGGEGFEYAYEDEEIADPKTKAEVFGTLVEKGIMPLAKAQEAYGIEPEDFDDEDGNPTNATADTVVQDTALNGAQIASLLQIVQAVTDKSIPVETASAMIEASFPTLSDEQIKAMTGKLDSFEKPKQQAASPASGLFGAGGGESAPPPAKPPQPPKPPLPDVSAEKIAVSLANELEKRRMFVPARTKRT